MPLPAIVGMEAAGEIVALPTDPEVLNHPEFKARCYAIGAKAIAVRITAKLQSFILSCPLRTLGGRTRSTSPSLGTRSTLSLLNPESTPGPVLLGLCKPRPFSRS